MRARSLLFLLGLLGCNQNPVEPVGPSAGSETHWLETCDSDADCGEDGACICQVCTVPCASAGECSALGPAARCALAGAPEAAELCGVFPPAAAGLCARGCGGGCPDGQACGAQDVCVPVETPDQPRQRAQAITPPARHAVDFLFVVDDSGSMCQEQSALGRSVEAVVPTLAGLDHRIAVISTDMRTAGRQGRFLADPAAPEPSLNCTDAEGQPFVPDTADCADFLAGDLPEIIGARETPDLVRLKGWFRCLVTVGTQGDGFEKGLAASHRALDCEGPNRAHFGACCTESGYDPEACESPDFLRPEADLVVVYLTDEDDCSDPASDPSLSELPICRGLGVDADNDTTPDAYAEACPADPRGCFQADCGLLDIEACLAERCMVSRAQNSNCEWHRDRLLPVQNLSEYLLDLKGDPGAVAVWSFVGEERRDAEGRVLRFTEDPPAPICNPVEPAYDPAAFPDQCCTEGLCPGEVQTTCGSDLGQAFAGHRYLELARSLPFGCAPGDERAACSVCDDIELAPPLATLPALAYATCLDARPACSTRAGDKLVPCDAEALENPGNFSLRAEVACPTCDEPSPPRTLASTEYRLVATPRCPGGLLFVPDPAVVPPGTEVQLTYQR